MRGVEEQGTGGKELRRGHREGARHRKNTRSREGGAQLRTVLILRCLIVGMVGQWRNGPGVQRANTAALQGGNWPVHRMSQWQSVRRR